MSKIKTTYIFGNKKNISKLDSNENIIIDTNEYSNYFIFRKFYDIISHKNFNKDSTYFIFEFSNNLFIEVFFRPLNKYITISTTNGIDILIDGNSDKLSYEYTIIDDYIDIFDEFINNFYQVDNQVKELHRYLTLFITYLNHNYFKYTIISLPDNINYIPDGNYA